MTGHREPGPRGSRVVDLPLPAAGPGAVPVPREFGVVRLRDRRYRLWVSDLGLACCSVEVMCALQGRTEPGADTGRDPAPIDVLVVSGTCTDTMAPAVRRYYDELPGSPRVICFGACTSTGGPYWDSYCVTKGVDQIIPVDVYVPGCPPRPEALLHGLLVLAGQDDVPGPTS